jgi:hypothetical protein
MANHNGDPDDFPLMTLDEFINALANRGVRLTTARSNQGRPVVTNGRVRYTLPPLPRGLLSASQVWSLLRLFVGEETANLLRFEFHLRPGPDD